MTNDPAWQWWIDKLRGDIPLALSESTPHAGFYRWPKREAYGAKRYFVPVAYWPNEDGELNCRIGEEDVTPERGRDIWVSVGAHPVSEEDYREVAERGGRWRDEHELVPMQRSNQPQVPEDNSFEALRNAINEMSLHGEARLSQPMISNQDEGDRIANFVGELSDLHRRANEARSNEKRPHDDAAKAVQAKWKPWVDKAETLYKALKRQLLTPFLQTEEKRLERRVQVGTRGRAISLKTIKRAEIVDFQECLSYFADSRDVHDFVQELADKAVRADDTAIPGVKVIEESTAV